VQFGPKSGSEYIVSAYVDDGFTERPNRKIMIDPLFKYVGLSICEHRSYGKMLVIIYAEKFEKVKGGRLLLG